MPYTTVQKFGVSKIFVSHAHQGCIYLISKDTVKAVILLNIITN